MRGFYRSLLICTTICFSLAAIETTTTDTPLISKSTNELDAATATFLDGFSKTFASIANLSIPEQRAIIKEIFSISENQLESMENIKDKVIFGKHGPINNASC